MPISVIIFLARLFLEPIKTNNCQFLYLLKVILIFLKDSVSFFVVLISKIFRITVLLYEEKCYTKDMDSDFAAQW